MRRAWALVAILSCACMLGCRAKAAHESGSKVVMATQEAIAAPSLESPEKKASESIAEAPSKCVSKLLEGDVAKPSDPSDLLFYVNRWNAIPAAYPVSATSIWSPCAQTPAPGDKGDLVCLPAAYSFRNREALRQVAFEDTLPEGVTTTFDGLSAGHDGKLGFKALIDAAKSEAGFELFVRSGFRAYTMQSATFHEWVAEEVAKGRSLADATMRVRTYSAAPGHSEHQLGTTADLVYREPNGVIYDGWDPEKISSSPPMVWALANAHRFGLVLTYEKDRSDVTQYVWEPWHFRYVGFEAANDMKRCGLSTEEMLQARYKTGPLPPFETPRRPRSARR